MRRLLVTTASVIALGLGGIGLASAQGTNTPQPGAAGGSPAATAPATTQSQTEATKSETSAANKTESKGMKMSARGTATPMTQSEIRQAQLRLRQDHLYTGRIDGRFGPKTKSALARFQRQNHLPATARLDRQTMSELLGGGLGQGTSEAPKPAQADKLSTSHNPPTQENTNMGQGSTLPPAAAPQSGGTGSGQSSPTTGKQQQKY